MADELNLDEIVTLPPEDLSNEQKTFLNENKDSLTDEQKETFKDFLKEEEEKLPEPEVRIPTSQKKETPEPEDEEEVAPEDKKVIGKLVGERLGPLEKKVQEQADRAEVDSLIANRPEFAKYRERILTYMKHPSYQNIPASNIANIVAGKDLMKIGAEKEREAQRKANETKGGGGSARKPDGEGVDWHTASKEEFEKKKAEVLRGEG